MLSDDATAQAATATTHKLVLPPRKQGLLQLKQRQHKTGQLRQLVQYLSEYSAKKHAIDAAASAAGAANAPGTHRQHRLAVSL